MFAREPVAALSPYVARLWVSDPPRVEASARGRERVLPTGDAHLVFRATLRPLRLYSALPAESDHPTGVVRGALLGGPRSCAYEKDLSDLDETVGAVFRPGAIREIFRLSAARLRDRHQNLSDLGRTDTERVRSWLFRDDAGPFERLERLEEWLLGLTAGISEPRGETREALEVLEQRPSSVAEAASIARCSPRVFIERVRDAVGVTPVEYRRITRFRDAVSAIRSATRRSLCGIALDVGYSDQAHFTREFRAFAGMTPARYRSDAGQHAFHVAAPVSRRG